LLVFCSPTRVWGHWPLGLFGLICYDFAVQGIDNMYKLFIALRYLRRNLLSILGILSVAVAVMVPLCVLSVMKGFEDEMRAGSRETLSDISVRLAGEQTFDGYEKLIERIKKIDHVVAVAPELSGFGLLKLPIGEAPLSNGKTRTIFRTHFVQYRGIDLEQEKATSDFVGYYQKWRAQEAMEELKILLESPQSKIDIRTIAAVSFIANRLRPVDYEVLTPGQKVALDKLIADCTIDIAAAKQVAISATPEWTELQNPKREAPAFLGSDLARIATLPNGQVIRLGSSGKPAVLIIPTSETDSTRVFQTIRNSGCFKTKLYDYDSRTLVLPLATLQRRIRKPGHISQINIRLDGFEHAPKVQAMLWGTLTPTECGELFAIAGPIMRQHFPEAHKVAQSQIDFLREQSETALSREIRDSTSRFVGSMQPLFMATFGSAEGALARYTYKPTPEVRTALRPYATILKERAATRLPHEYHVITWEDQRTGILRAVRVERRILAFVMSFVTLIAGVLILVMLYTLVRTKTKDIGILKSIGGSTRGILALFVLNGTLIGIIGASIGMYLGLLLSQQLPAIENILSDWFGFRLFPREIYYLDRLPVDKNPLPNALFFAGAAILVSFLASAIPAYIAARQDPVEALRYE
jgi:ABC-type lipoprotein release transport system permease subunit